MRHRVDIVGRHLGDPGQLGQIGHIARGQRHRGLRLVLSAVIILESYVHRLASFSTWAVSARGRTTKPVFSLGVKNVDLGGISKASRAVRLISLTLTGRMSTAATAFPLATSANVSSRPCW